MKSPRNLSLKYRPRRFEDVLGQDYPVRFLSGLIRRGQIGRSFLLTGTVGSGKTTLARIYGAALNCLKPAPYTGSPCGTCNFCKLGSCPKAGFYEYDTTGSDGSRNDINAWVNQLNRTPTEYRWRVLFFDEAHGLTKDLFDSLLKRVEEPAPNVIFGFATTEPDKVRAAMQSRLLRFEVRPLDAVTAVDLLDRVAREENIPCDREALALLADLQDGYPRNLLNALEQVCDYALSQSGADEGQQAERITIERVSAAFEADQAEVLVRYFGALATGDAPLQTKLILGWRESPADKVRWVQLFLLSLYYNDVLRQPAVVDPLTHSIPKVKRAPIIAAFRERLNVATDRELAPFWRTMMAAWPIPVTPYDDAGAHLRFALFQTLVNQGSISADLGRMPITGEARRGRSRPVRVRAPTMSRQARRPQLDPEYMTREEVRELIDRSSFLIQEHGVVFNARFLLRPCHFGVDTDKACIHLISEFCRHLAARVKAWSGSELARLTVFERDAEGLRGLVVAHLPRTERLDCLAKAADWIEGWQGDRRTAPVDEAFGFLAGPLEGKAALAKAELAFHWDVVLDLCAGLNPAEEVEGSGTPRPLLDQLGLPLNRWRKAGQVPDRRFAPSTPLGPDAIAWASRNKMQPLSAFGAEAWKWVKKGWERNEHEDRKRTAEERVAEVAEAERLHGAGTAAARIAIEKLKASWPDRAEDRDRSWEGWWPRGEA